jgi:hypothetical protein
MILITKPSHGAVLPHSTLTQGIPVLGEVLTPTGEKRTRKTEKKPSASKCQVYAD